MSLKRRPIAWTAVIASSSVPLWDFITSSYEAPVQAGTMRYVPRHHVLRTSVEEIPATSGAGVDLSGLFTQMENTFLFRNGKYSS
jgi:hypothetical protein